MVPPSEDDKATKLDTELGVGDTENKAPRTDESDAVPCPPQPLQQREKPSSYNTTPVLTIF